MFIVDLTNRCKVMASGRIDATYRLLPGVYFVRTDMLEKKHRHTHIIKITVKGLSGKSEADDNRVVWR